MPHTVFISQDNNKWSGDIGSYLEAADDLIVCDHEAGAATKIELTGKVEEGQIIRIISGDSSMLLPSSTSLESLLFIIRLLARNGDEAGFEKNIYFSLMQKMVKIVGHDVRNPLNNILLATAQFKLESLPDAEETVMYVDIIERSCDRINNLMSEIAEPLSEQALNTVPISLKDLVEIVAQEFRDQMELYDIRWQLNDGYGGLLLLDEERMRSAIGQIIENAIESMKGGGQLNATIGITNDGWQRLLIRDTGSGIDKEHITKVFYPFYTTKERKKGLGLSLAKKIIDAHGGRIEIKSEEHAGTEIAIYFPIILNR